MTSSLMCRWLIALTTLTWAATGIGQEEITPLHSSSTTGTAQRSALTAQSNSVRWINVAQADGQWVREPLVATEADDETIAAANSQRIRAILSSPAVGEDCTFYFPAGKYFFDGAAPGEQATIESTAERQTFAGDGMNATLIVQKSTSVASTFRIAHDRCIIRDLMISSADQDKDYRAAWDDNRHGTAIHLAAPEDRWYVDPQILNVNINSHGNNIVLRDFFRPFDIGVKVTGPWLNVYVHTMWMRGVKNAIYVNEGQRIAGPAKFIDVNAYATPPDKSKLWNTFFKSEGYLMEQMELIHCTYIGSQFIYIDGAPIAPDTRHAPAYNMVIDHNYINNCWQEDEGDPQKSGVYLHLPPLADGSNYSRDIRFTNNSCTGRAPRRGAFFYVTGTCRGITVSENDIMSGGHDKCIYIRATSQVKAGEGIAIRDIKITNNYIRNYRSPITVGGDLHDPSRDEAATQGVDDDPYVNERVIIAGNQTMNLDVIATNGLTTCYLNQCRKVTVSNNSFVNTAKSVFIARKCEELTVVGNNFGGLDGAAAQMGIELLECHMANLSGNTIRGLDQGIRIESSQQVSVCQNVIGETTLGLAMENVSGATVQGNSLQQCQTGLSLKNCQKAAVSGNQVDVAGEPAVLQGLRDGCITGNLFMGAKGCQVAGDNERVMVRSNVGLADRE